MKQTQIGMLSAMSLCARYNRMSETQRAAVREERLKALINWAREKSPYYAALNRQLKTDNIKLSDLPPVSKTELMTHWDEWVTDRQITLAEVNTFMKNTDNIGRKLKGKWLVFTTSGSTGSPLVALCDQTTYHVMSGINAVRSIARKEDMKRFILRGGKSIGVFATGGFYLGNSTVRNRLLSMPWKKKQLGVTSALLPIDDIVKKLNDFQPAMLGGYPTNLELLIEPKKRGQLSISPALIMTGGEYLSDKLRAALSEAFGCYVQTSYSCTEGGTVACECREQHFHINDDWLIVEPVDRENRPVPDGVQADKILLTNLYNYTQPFIRYEVTDRVVMHREACHCGNPSPWLTLEGRTDDVVSFERENQEIKLAPLALYAVLKEVHVLRRFQFIARSKHRAELRLEPADGVSSAEAFEQAKQSLERFFLAHGLTNIEVVHSAQAPAPDPNSGKFKHIINLACG